MANNGEQAPSGFKLGISLNKPHLLLPGELSWWTEIHSNYIRTQDYECWHIIKNGDYVIDPILDLKNYTSLEFGRLEKNHKEKQLILNGITRQDVDKVMLISSAKEVWEAIYTLHQGSKDDQASLKFDPQRQLHSFAMKVGESVSSYHSLFQILCDNMKVSNADMEKVDISLPFIHGMDSRFTTSKRIMLMSKEADKLA